MSKAARQLLESFDALPEQDQEIVAAEIVRRFDVLEGSVSADSDEPFTDEEWAEIQRRRAEYFENPAAAIPWEEVRASLYRRFA